MKAETKQVLGKSEIKDLIQSKEMSLNGFNWCYFERGLHTFSKKVGTGYEVIKAKAIDLTNGNIEFFTQNGISR